MERNNAVDVKLGLNISYIVRVIVFLTGIFILAIGSVLNIVIVGFFLNIILNSGMIPSFTEKFPRVIMLILGIIFMGTGSGMYVSSKVGAGPRDGMTLFISNKFSISVGLSRTILEFIALTCSWLVGGPVALGTFITVPFVGPVMQKSLKVCTRGLEKLKL